MAWINTTANSQYNYRKHAGEGVISVLIASIITLAIFSVAAAWASSENRKKDIVAFADDISQVIDRAIHLKRSSQNFTLMNNLFLTSSTSLPNGIAAGAGVLKHSYRGNITVAPSGILNSFIITAVGVPQESCAEAFVFALQLNYEKGVTLADINGVAVALRPVSLSRVNTECSKVLSSIFNFRITY